ncbi:Ribosomal protein S18 acetylase RimI [Pedobacter steynii]|uniref:Ribosomal protein S18 acetylase RimI n=1 Tax=Pedobacter steynii TaxID=430522 RepID=A0A1H0HJS5_9SPHI|nr:GNAT family N-acetyltransferase [Pedobacter steynii]NQX42590.1 GNAT family N-acetyltransferase [Pedobacter steynii]SDO19456.1 Ribosomal protein S18 acetylase RimI [Pedobacter steynii]
MKDILIRKATFNDMETLLLFEQGVVAAERPFDPTLKPAGVKYYDIDQMINSTEVELLVAASGDEVIGSGYARIESVKPYLLHEQHAYLGFMYVDPRYRGLGVNQKIIEALSSWSASRGITELRLDVYQTNEPAIKAYEKAGFTRHIIQMRKEI